CEGITTNVTEVVVKRNGNVTWVKAQLENELTSQISFTQVEQEQDSRFSSTVVTTGGHLVRNNLHIRLNGTNCNSYMYGLYLLSGEQLCDNHTLVDHAMPHCESNELYKGVLGGKSTGVFNGKIFVRQDAQKTNAYQSNKNILLSDDAQMNTKPQLEIFADDVKCSHGTTTGQLDDEALFYLRARGIGEQSARTLLNIAFAADVLDHIEMETLKQNLQSIAEEKLMHS
ncbi:MAG: Fe-S cluster assembly protein SufD, partial [Bacteroidota bacterium]